MTGAVDIPKYILQAGEVERENLKIRSIQIDSTSSYRQSKCIITIWRNTSVLWARRTCFYRYYRRVWHQFHFVSETNYPHKPSYRNHCLCWLKRLVYLAVDNGILRYNPLDDIKYEKKAPTKLMYISKNQLQEIMSHPNRIHYRNLQEEPLYFHVLRFGLR